MTKITEKTFIKALDKSGGNQSTIAQRLDVHRSAVTLFLNKNHKMKELCEIEGERIIDVAENNIDYDVVTNKNIETSKWKLTHSKRGKARGYGPKQEIEQIGEQQPIEIKIIMPNESNKTSSRDKTHKKAGKGLDKTKGRKD